MEDGGWRLGDGGWIMKDWGWRMEDGNGGWEQYHNAVLEVH